MNMHVRVRVCECGCGCVYNLLVNLRQVQLCGSGVWAFLHQEKQALLQGWNSVTTGACGSPWLSWAFMGGIAPRTQPGHPGSTLAA